MRERREHGTLNVEGQGITPAYAGKTYGECVMKMYIKDHPRVCGKDLLFLLVLFSFLGSPPRMRERQEHEEPTKSPNGITPAYAGKT